MVYLCWEDMMVLIRPGSVDGWVGGHFWLVNIFSLLRRHGLSNNITNDSDDNSIACGHISHSDEGTIRIEVPIDRPVAKTLAASVDELDETVSFWKKS